MGCQGEDPCGGHTSGVCVGGGGGDGMSRRGSLSCGGHTSGVCVGGGGEDGMSRGGSAWEGGREGILDFPDFHWLLCVL